MLLRGLYAVHEDYMDSHEDCILTSLPVVRLNGDPLQHRLLVPKV